MKLPVDEINFSFTRSGGPGGQNVNKVNTKAVLQWDVLNSQWFHGSWKDRFLKKYKNYIFNNGFQITSESFRSQIQNKEACLKRLHQMLMDTKKAPKVRKKTKPSLRAVQKRIDQKKRQGAKKKDRQKNFT